MPVVQAASSGCLAGKAVRLRKRGTRNYERLYYITIVFHSNVVLTDSSRREERYMPVSGPITEAFYFAQIV